MEKYAFAPQIDVPLTLLTVIGFMLHFNWWARSHTSEATVLLEERLLSAKIRVMLLFLGIAIFCSIANVAVWAIFALALGIGIAFSLISGDGDGAFVVLAAAWLIREWSFGFPESINHPPEDLAATEPGPPNLSAGMQGTVVSPLRPSGEVEVDGRKIPAVSETGELLEIGSDVVVSRMEDGRVFVRALGDD